MINYRGRKLDGAALWEEFVDFPPNADLSSGFAPLVVCPNPEHGSTKKHFQVNLDKPLVHCFALCGISGTYEQAIAKIRGCSEKEARKIVVRHTRVSLGPASKRKRRGSDGRVRAISPDKEPEALDSFDRYLPPVAIEYLEARGIAGGAISAWGLGWDADEHRIVIPVDDERGVARFLIKRAIREKDWPKYLYWPEGAVKTAVLFGACKLDRTQVSSLGLALVEGSIDTIVQQGYGVPAGGILGTGLSDRQAQIIRSFRPKRIYHMFDKDGAGVRNTLMAADKLTNIPNFVCLYPRGKGDPAELTRKESEHIIENAIPLSQFKRRLRERGIDMQVTKPERRERKVSIG